jgi:hypothetical protein
MPTPPLSPQIAKQAVDAYAKYGSQNKAADALGINRATFQHRLNEGKRMGLSPEFPLEVHGREHFDIDTGYIVIASDCHFWPGIRTTAYRAFLEILRELKPSLTVLNGDVFDGACISRHPLMRFESGRPSVAQELQACKERLDEIEAVAGKNLYWTLGNHDARFEAFLANQAPQYDGVKGVSLRDHFPMWKPAMSLFVNDDLVIKHRNKSGIHAPYNNALMAGRSIVTGHMHSLKVYPVTDYGGTRWGVDCGTLAQPYGPQFAYTEDNVVPWRSGFCVVRYKDRRLLTPTLVRVVDEDAGEVEWGVETFKV